MNLNEKTQDYSGDQELSFKYKVDRSPILDSYVTIHSVPPRTPFRFITIVDVVNKHSFSIEQQHYSCFGIWRGVDHS